MNVVANCFSAESSISAVPLEVAVPNFVELIDVEFSITSLPSCSDSSRYDENSGDDSISGVAELGNCSGTIYFGSTTLPVKFTMMIQLCRCI
jgi:hypothetical protein